MYKISLNHVQKAVFWKKSPHTVQVYKEEIPLFSLAFLALLACVTLWEWLCKPYTLKKQKGKKKKAKTQIFSTFPKFASYVKPEKS